MPITYENREPAMADAKPKAAKAEPAVAEDTEDKPAAKPSPEPVPEPSPPAETYPGFPAGNGPAAPQLHPELHGQ